MELQAVVPCPGLSFPAWAAALVGYHDLGKASPGFQRLLGRVAVPGFVLPAASPDRHDAMTVPILTAQLQKLGLARETARALAAAVGAHHGSIVASTEVMAAGAGPPDATQPGQRLTPSCFGSSSLALVPKTCPRSWTPSSCAG